MSAINEDILMETPDVYFVLNLGRYFLVGCKAPDYGSRSSSP
jgi:hypothetical protein